MHPPTLARNAKAPCRCFASRSRESSQSSLHAQEGTVVVVIEEAVRKPNPAPSVWRPCAAMGLDDLELPLLSEAYGHSRLLETADRVVNNVFRVEKTHRLGRDALHCPDLLKRSEATRCVDGHRAEKRVGKLELPRNIVLKKPRLRLAVWVDRSLGSTDCAPEPSFARHRGSRPLRSGLQVHALDAGVAELARGVVRVVAEAGVAARTVMPVCSFPDCYDAPIS